MQLVVGRVGRPHGIRGELTVQVHTDDPDLRFAAGSVLATEPADAGPADGRRRRAGTPGRLLVTFEGYADRDSAEDLRGTLLVMDSAEVGPPADPDEFHDYQLIGLEVLTVGGEPVGVVADVLHQGQDLLVVQPAVGPGRADGRYWSRSSRPSCRRSMSKPGDWSSTRRRACSTWARPARRGRSRCGSTSSRSFPSTSPRSGSR